MFLCNLIFLPVSSICPPTCLPSFTKFLIVYLFIVIFLYISVFLGYVWLVPLKYSEIYSKLETTCTANLIFQRRMNGSSLDRSPQ